MIVQVGLVLFAVNSNNPINAYVLVKDKDLLELPTTPLVSFHKNSLNAICDIITQATYITGNWTEFQFIEQAGFYDDIERVPDKREILLVYSLILPDRTSLKPGFMWLSLDELGKRQFYADHYSIIRYCRTIQKR